MARLWHWPSCWALLLSPLTDSGAAHTEVKLNAVGKMATNLEKKMLTAAGHVTLWEQDTQLFGFTAKWSILVSYTWPIPTAPPVSYA